MDWRKLCALDEIPRRGSRVVHSPHGDIAVFRTSNDEVFALLDRCPHKGGPLSQGIVTGRVITCPLHGWKIQLQSGAVVAPDKGCAKPFPTKIEGGSVWIAI